MLGVHAKGDMFISEIKDGFGRKRYLGIFDSEYKAHEVWRCEKLAMLRVYINRFKEIGHSKLVSFLVAIESKIVNDIFLGVPTTKI